MAHFTHDLFFSTLFPTDKAALAIKCYECTVHPRRQQNITERLCTKFEETDYFEVDCPYSTMCKKRVYRYQLINKVQESIERGCANQKNDSMVREVNVLSENLLNFALNPNRITLKING